MKKKLININNSNSYWKRALKHIPAGTQSLSKAPSAWIENISPKYILKGDGCYLEDVDGNKFLDFGGALGPIILGYNHPNTNQAVIEQLKNGIIFSLLNPLEVELSEVLAEEIPIAEMVRFGKSGSDATSIAVRVARAYTKRDKIICIGYHGWQDWYIATTERNKGIPKAVLDLTLTCDYNNLSDLDKIFKNNKDEIACVILETVYTEEPKEGYLEGIREICKKNNALLILDEIKMGFRIAIGGGMEYYKIDADLVTFGKSMANGMPISVLAGKEKFMRQLDKEVFYSFTFAGETLSLAASISTIKYIKENRVIDHVWNVGDQLKIGFQRLTKKYNLDKYYKIVGPGPYSTVQFTGDDKIKEYLVKSIFIQECALRNIIFGGYHIINYSHTKEIIEDVLNKYDEILCVISKSITNNNLESLMIGKPIIPVFQKVFKR